MGEFSYRVRIDEVFDNKYDTMRVKVPFIVYIERSLCMWSFSGFEDELEEIYADVTQQIIESLNEKT